MVDDTLIKKEAKQIMDSFMEKLSEIEVEESYHLKRQETVREDEETKKKLDEEFKTKFLQNAPNHSTDAIIANKGSWVE